MFLSLSLYNIIDFFKTNSVKTERKCTHLEISIDKIDKRLAVSSSVNTDGLCFYDVREEPFDVYGFYCYRSEPIFKRLPDEIARNTNSGVAGLYTNTAGGRVRFATDSERIVIVAEMPGVCHMPHMPLCSSAGFDLYVDSPEDKVSRFYNVFKPYIGMDDGYTSEINFSSKKLRYLTVNFPSYSNVSALYIGICEGARLEHGLKYRNVLPIVYYGSSITQGACSSRPGNAFANIISRRTNTDFINLGFSGSAKGEEVIARYMATLPMSVFVSDYDHNSTVEELRQQHYKLYEIIRQKNPLIPYIMISRADFNKRTYEENLCRRNIVFESYRTAKSNKDENVYFIDGSGIYRTVNEDMCTVDGTHPNDYGFFLMADAIESELRWIWASADIV